MPAAHFKNFSRLPRDEKAQNGASAERSLNPEDKFLTTADELHDLVAVSGFDFRFGPFRPWQNFQVAFDGHAPRIQSQLAKQVRHGGPGLRRALFSIDRDCNCCLHPLSVNSPKARAVWCPTENAIALWRFLATIRAAAP